MKFTFFFFSINSKFCKINRVTIVLLSGTRKKKCTNYQLKKPQKNDSDQMSMLNVTKQFACAHTSTLTNICLATQKLFVKYDIQ